MRYTITMTAQSGANTSDVFDVILIDNLDLGLAYVANSATVSTGAGVGADNALLSTDVTGDGISTPQTLIWGVANLDLDIQAGDTVTLEYEVQVLNNVVANTVLNNSVVAQWTSTDGANGLERDGRDGAGGLNDYVTPVVTETLTTPDISAIISKERFTDTFDVNDNNVRIGDIIYYTLTIPMPEGTLGNLQLVDALPQGLDFEGIVSISGDATSPYNATAPFAYSDIPDTDIVEAGDPTTGPTTVTSSWQTASRCSAVIDGRSSAKPISRARSPRRLMARETPRLSACRAGRASGSKIGCVAPATCRRCWT